IMLEAVYPACRPTIARLLPCKAIGWWERLLGPIFSRMLRVVSCRRIPGVVGSASPWHLRHTSYSYFACGLTLPDIVTPGTPRSGPDVIGAISLTARILPTDRVT